MKITYALLIAGIMASLTGSVALMTSAFFADAASHEVASWDAGGLWTEPGTVNRDGPAEDYAARADHAVAVVLARMLHRSEADKIAGN